MRWAFLIIVVSALSGCAGSSMSNSPITDYSPDTGSRSSLKGNQGGAGVQGALWSNDPNKSTVTSRYFTPKD